MNGIMEFNLKRFLLLIRNDIYLNMRAILITSVIVAAGLVLSSRLGIKFSFIDSVMLFYKDIYFLVLPIGGLIINNKIFKSMHDEVKGPGWLTLPASMFEKYASRISLSTILFAAGTMALFFLTSLISKGLYLMFSASSHALFNPFDKTICFGTAAYFGLFSIFMLGSIYFKKIPFIKTILCLVILYFLLDPFFVILHITLTHDYYNYILYSGMVVDSVAKELIPVMGPIGNILKWTIHIYFCYVLALSCWIIGFIRLKEKEI